MEPPAGLADLGRSAAGRAWLERLPTLVSECAAAWGLEVGTPYEDASVSLVAPCRRAGEPLVLKVQFPHRESEHEADALAAWDGEGAVRLLDHDASRQALLLERCDPGTHLSAIGATEAIEVMARLLPRLWIDPPPGVTSLADEAAHWRSSLRRDWERSGRSVEESLVGLAEEVLDDLGSGRGDAVLLHQDLHGDNVLAARRAAWLAIDPKPLAGEREFSIAPVVRSWEFGHGRAAVLGRLDHLVGALGLDRDRATGWAFASTLAWAFDGDEALPRHVETARWLAARL